MQSLDAISQNYFCSFPGKPFSITVIQMQALTSNVEEAQVEWLYEDLKDFLELIPKKDFPFIIGEQECKLGSQETLGVTGNFFLGVQNKSVQRLIIDFWEENTLVIANNLFQ